MYHIVGGSTEGALPHPNVTISKVQFSPDATSQLLAVSSWDCTVRIYYVPSGPLTCSERRVFSHSQPVLACSFLSNDEVVSGGIDGSLKSCKIESGSECDIGRHEGAIRCIEYCNEHSLIAAGGWDGCLKLWDYRMKELSGSCSNNGKVYAMDVHDNRVIVGTSEKKIFVWDVRNLGEPEQLRDSPLKFQTRALKFFPKGDAFVVSSIEGRVAVEYMDLSAEVQKGRYAFKCHREKAESGEELIYPVNCIAFHPLYSTFVTGGSDAYVSIWDPFNRKRICQLHKFSTSIVCVSFNANGSQLAIASSYMQELKEKPNPEPENTVIVRKITDVEARPKQL